MIIKDHKALAELIAGKRILHLESLGKDSAATLHWLATFAHPSHIVAAHFERLAKHPDDARYLAYKKKKYPNVEFILVPNPIELSQIGAGMYQSPLSMLEEVNKWEWENFEFKKLVEETRLEHACDYVSSGIAKYESVIRATLFYRKGIIWDNWIYPIGMFTKDEVLQVVRNGNIKLHPSYKFSKSTHDFPSWYKMRSAFITNPEYKKSVLAAYPLLALDGYRYERLLNEKP